MLNNFIENGINEHDIHILLSYDSEVDTKTYYVWNKIIEKYKGVNFYFYPDIRVSKNYVSSIRLNVLSQFYKEHPDFSKKPVFYHDCDILFTKPVDYSEFIGDDIWYLSDTNSYISYDYIGPKGHGIYEKMCEIIGIDSDIPKRYTNHSGGAQYIIKNVDWRFWETVESDSELLFTKMTEYNISLKTEYPNYHELQIWCADMWAVLWGAWRRGWKTNCLPEFDFSWGTSTEDDFYKMNIMHNAGVTSPIQGLFYKAEFMNSLPYNAELNVNDKSASKKYWEWIQRTAEKSKLL